MCIFVCAECTCDKCWKEWRALRLQISQETSEQVEEQGDDRDHEPESTSTTSKGKAAADDDGWWNDTSWGDGGDAFGSSGGDVQGDGTTAEEDILQALQQSLSLASEGSSTSKGKQKKKKKERREKLQLSSKILYSPNALPGFYLHQAPEPKPNKKAASKLDLRVKQLVEEFNQEQEGSSTKTTITITSSGGRDNKKTDAVASSSQQQDNHKRGEGEKGKEKQQAGVVASWTNEQYEAEPADEKQFNKFLERVNLEPSQCIRYCGGGLLWPSKDVPSVPECDICGSARQPVLQVMSPIVAYLLESIQWELEAGRTYQGNLDSADFMTCVVYVCTNLCRGGEKSAECLKAKNQEDEQKGRVFVEHCCVKAEDMRKPLS